MSEDVTPRLWPAIERTGVIAAILLCFLGAYMTYGINFSGRPLPQGLRSPILSMEVPTCADDIRLTVGCGTGEKRQIACENPLDSQDRGSMRLAQYADMAFIPLYIALFVAAGLTQMRISPSIWGWLGAVAVVTAIAAAALDYRENFAILATLDRIDRKQALSASAIANAAWWKWGLLFTSLLCLVPLMFAKGARSMTLKVISRALCAYVVVSALAGLLACWFRHPTRLESASSAFIALPLLMLLRPFLRDGTLEGLNWLAGLWGLRWLARWPEFIFHEEENPRERSGQHAPQLEEQ